MNENYVDMVTSYDDITGWERKDVWARETQQTLMHDLKLCSVFFYPPSLCCAYLEAAT